MSTARTGARASADFNDGGSCTAMPCRLASRLTAEGSVRRPRPLGRSGWVSTSATSKPAARIAASAVAANAGVPANPTVMAYGAARRGSAGKPLLLALFVLEPEALQRRKIVDEHFADEVVHFVLDANGEQLIGCPLERFAMLVAGAHGHSRGAGDLVVVPRHRKAAFLAQDL